MERELLEFDVQFVGAGPAGLAGAIHLANLIKRHEADIAQGGPGKSFGEVTIAVLEEAARVGAHALSGAVMDPRAMRGRRPDYRAQGCPIASGASPAGRCMLWRNGQTS